MPELKGQKSGFQISIDQKAFTREDLINGDTPKWDDLHYIGISNKEEADIFVNEHLDKPITAPNGFHLLGGSLRELYGQKIIDKQVDQIINGDIPAGLITYLSVREYPVR